MLQVTNHGLPKKVMDEMIEVSKSFFDLTEEEKGDYSGKKVFDPIKYGTSFNASLDKSLYWRDHLKVFVHPHFNAPLKPNNFRFNLLCINNFLLISLKLNFIMKECTFFFSFLNGN